MIFKRQMIAFLFECPQYLKSKYLYYILLCQKNTIYSKVRKASIPRLPRSAIEKLIIPVPNVDIQEKNCRCFGSLRYFVMTFQRSSR